MALQTWGGERREIPNLQPSPASSRPAGPGSHGVDSKLVRCIAPQIRGHCVHSSSKGWAGCLREETQGRELVAHDTTRTREAVLKATAVRSPWFVCVCLKSGSQLACQTPGALPCIDTKHRGDIGAWGTWGWEGYGGGWGTSGWEGYGGGLVGGLGVGGYRGRGGDMGEGGGDKGHLAQAAYTAPPLGACPKGTSHNELSLHEDQSCILNKSVCMCHLENGAHGRETPRL